jgi:hypothetical protein
MQIQAPSYIHICIYIYTYTQNTLPTVGLLEVTRRGGKEEENGKRMNNIEIHHTCIGTRHKTH